MIHRRLKFGTTQKRSVAMSLVALTVMAATCEPAPEPEDPNCVPYAVENFCGSAGTSVEITFGMPAEESGDYVVRIHPDDASKYQLSEVSQGVPDERTGNSMAVIEWLGHSPFEVCLEHDMYLQNTRLMEQTSLFPAGHCGSIFLNWNPGNANWVSYDQ